MANVLLQVKGVEELIRKLRWHKRAFIGELAQALPEEAKRLEAAAQQGVPRASGRLASSVAVVSEVQSNAVHVAVGYTDPKAAAVHEGIHWRRRVKDVHGFKWLERALNAFEQGFAERIAARLRRLVE